MDADESVTTLICGRIQPKLVCLSVGRPVGADPDTTFCGFLK